jgi:hypothetical protein
MRIACWIPNATNTHTLNYIIFIVFHQNGCRNAPQWDVILPLPDFLCSVIQPNDSQEAGRNKQLLSDLILICKKFYLERKLYAILVNLTLAGPCIIIQFK